MSYSGSWKFTLQSPMGPIIFDLAATENSGVLTGTCKTSLNDAADIQNGKVEGGVATWDMPVTKPMKLALGFSATLNGDNISGTVKIGTVATAKFEGARV